MSGGRKPLIRYLKRRYLALRVDGAGPFDQKAVSDAVWDSVLRLFGEVGCSQAGLYLIRFEEERNYGVLRCSHKALPMVKAAVASVTKIGDQPAAIHIVRVAGSLKGLSRKMNGAISRQ